MLRAILSLIVFGSTLADAAPVVKDPPWHLADVWWDLGQAREFSSLSIDFEISDDVDPSISLYIAPLGLGTLNKGNFYAGVQTQSSGFASLEDHTLQPIGRGAIFSRWGERSLDAVRLAPGGVCESADYEGDFVSVRNRFAWNRGKYTLRMSQVDTERNGAKVYTWVALYLTNQRARQETYVGALRFAGSPLMLQKEMASFVEIYGGPFPAEKIPKLTVTFRNLQINGIAVSPLHASVAYEEGVPDRAEARGENGSVRIRIGTPVKRTGRRLDLF